MRSARVDLAADLREWLRGPLVPSRIRLGQVLGHPVPLRQLAQPGVHPFDLRLDHFGVAAVVAHHRHTSAVDQRLIEHDDIERGLNDRFVLARAAVALLPRPLIALPDLHVPIAEAALEQTGAEAGHDRLWLFPIGPLDHQLRAVLSGHHLAAVVLHQQAPRLDVDDWLPHPGIELVAVYAVASDPR